MWTRDPSPAASRSARPRSRAPFFLPPVLGAALAMLLPASTAGAVEGRKVQNVQVRVSLVEPRYRAKLSAGECADVEKGIEDALVTGLSRRFPHVGFGRDVASPWRLEGFVNHGRVFSPVPPATPLAELRPDVVSLHLRLVREEQNGDPRREYRVSLELEPLEAFFDAIPEADACRRAFAARLGEGLEDREDAEALALEAERHFGRVFDALVRRIPLFEASTIACVKVARDGAEPDAFLVIKAPRRDYRCTVPDLSEFEMDVEISEGGLDPQRRSFRSELLDDLDVDLVRNELADVAKGLVTRVTAPLADTGTEHLARLRSEPSEPVRIYREVFLLELGTLRAACLETSPTAFDPEQ